MYLELYSQVYILLADFYIYDVVNDSDCHPDNAERKCLLVEMNPYIEYDNQSDQRKHQMFEHLTALLLKEEMINYGEVEH